MSRVLSRRLTGGLRSEDGVTLAELLVVLVLTGLVLGAVTSNLIASHRIVRGTFERQQDLGQARVAIAAASADLRALTPLGTTRLLTSSATDVQFFARRDLTPGLGPTRIRLVVEGTELVRYATLAPADRGEAPATSDYPPQSAAQKRVLARGLVPGPLFSYYGASPASPLLNTFDANGVDLGVASTSTALVRSIGVTLRVQAPAGAVVEPATVSQIVHLPNLRDVGT